VVVPSYNEGTVVRGTLAALIAAGYTVVVVDDGSTDATPAALKGLRVWRLRHAVNLGQGAALQTGMDFALKRGAEVIVHFDADGQHRVEDLETLVEPVLKGETDVVLGSRFLRYQDTRMLPWLRALLLRVAVLVNGVLTGVWLTDAHNGLRVLSGAAARRIRLQENGFAHASEIVHQIKKAHLRFVERPTRIRYTSYSVSKGQSLWNAFNIVFDMILRGLFK
jgi:glycosyltransferase involved in cell wall biosynthesis